MNYQDVIKKYVEKFGKEPEFKGRNWGMSEYERMITLLHCIEKGKPYYEEDQKENEVF